MRKLSRPLSSPVIDAAKLLAWYYDQARDLPWRKTKDPYKIWVSEIMLQQTTVAAVIPFYLRWIKEFPTVKSVVRSPLQKILKAWQGLGYYSRAKNLWKSAKVVHKQFNGKLPQEIDLIRKLPGFGPYTTGAVLSIAFNKPIPVVDANVRRVMMRIMGTEDRIRKSHDDEIWNVLNGLIPKDVPGDFNQAMMELGATVCRPKEPLCNQCPVHRSCKAFSKGNQELIPVIEKKQTKPVKAVVGILIRDGKVFIQKRSTKGLLANFWEFPGGKVEPGEDLLSALKREMNEELGIVVRKIRPMIKVVHFYTEYKVSLNAFFCEGKEDPKEDPIHKFVSAREINQYPFPSGSTKIIDLLLKERHLR